MFNYEVRDYKYIPLEDVKQACKIHSTDEEFDSQLKDFIQAAVDDLEAFTNISFVPSVNIIEDYRICGDCYKIKDINIVLSAITYTDGNVLLSLFQ